MQVGSVSNVSFRANLIQQAIENGVGNPIVQKPAEQPVKKDDFAKEIADFKSTFKDKKWSKEYKKESNTLTIRNKKDENSIAYLISADGTVTKFGSEIKPEIIAVQDEDAKKLFDKKSNPKTFKDRIANFWKFFASTNQMMQATFKGLFEGTMAAIAFLSGSWLISALPKTFAKEGPKFMEIIKQPLKHIPKAGKVVAGIAGFAVLGYHLVVGKLRANQRTADIDHQLKTGHRD